MAATRAATNIIAPGTSVANGGTATGAVVNIATAYGGTITYKLTNGAALSTPPVLYFYGSSDNFATAGKLFYTVAGDIVASSVNQNAVDIPIGFQQIRVDCTGNTGGTTTAEAIAHVLLTV